METGEGGCNKECLLHLSRLAVSHMSADYGYFICGAMIGSSFCVWFLSSVLVLEGQDIEARTAYKRWMQSPGVVDLMIYLDGRPYRYRFLSS